MHMQYASARGFSLLEVLLSLALASLLLLAASYLVQMVMQRANWWYSNSEMLMLRQSVIKSFEKLSSQVCEPGLVYGGENYWRWQMRQDDRCQVYDIRHNTSKQQLQKRRLGGRYTGFIDSTRDLQLSYGVAEQGRCAPVRWLPEVNGDLAQQTVLLRLQYVVAGEGENGQFSEPDTDAEKGKGGRKITNQVLRLPCVIARLEVSE